MSDCSFKPISVRANHSTISAITLVSNDIISALDRRYHCASLFIALSKPSDTINHHLLLRKLDAMGLDENECAWLQSYLTDRCQMCCGRWGGGSECFIPIYPPHRQFLRFAFQGVCYEYRVLPFGLSFTLLVISTEAVVYGSQHIWTTVSRWHSRNRSPGRIRALLCNNWWS